jgi:membrane associated rhomboid family serine protease
LSQYQYGGVAPLTPIAKKLIIINLVTWVVLIMIVQNFLLNEPLINLWFGLQPYSFFNSFFLWQPFTYMFLHAMNPFHIVFNLLTLWWLGGELERLWGKKFFLFYYLACGVGAALIFAFGVNIYSAFTGNEQVLRQPVVGASGAIFGLLLAYGMIYGERTMLFLMIFPMKARYFVMILGGIELMNLLGDGFGGGVAYLCHLGGIIVGFLILKLLPRVKEYLVRRRTETHGRRLKLVVDNDTAKKPKYWN